MNKITTRQELIKLYIDFFKLKNHKEIPSSSLIPENDPTVLFTTAGMHPLVPFLSGQKHPLGKRLVDVQKCIRTQDIDEVGDKIHHTFFEMLGNWSLGDYWKKEAIEFTFEFVTKILKIPIENLGVSVFIGDKDAEKDNESAEIWKALGIPKERIAFLEKEDNWWGPAGLYGPCGPDTEIFYYVGKSQAPKNFSPKDKNWVEIGNNVLMQYNKTKKGFEKATQKNVDFGGGVERTLAVLNNLDDNYQSSIFQSIIKEIETLSKKKYGKNERETRHMRIIADHIRAATFILGDPKGIKPGNVGQGYVLRRLIRRAIRYGYVLGIFNKIREIAEPIFSVYDDYSDLQDNKTLILEELKKEEKVFEKTLEQGLKAAKKIIGGKIPLNEKKNYKIRNAKESIRVILQDILEKKEKGKDYSYIPANISKKEIDESLITGREGFLLFQSYGFPQEMILELAVKERFLFDEDGFKEELKKHQELSRTASGGMFKSGLADNSEKTTRLHTATHLLNEALREILGKEVKQKGSNITPERLRFDFNFSRKLTDEEIKKIEELVNKKIKESLEVKREELPLKKAISSGAQNEFGAKYPEIVSVYSIGNFSKEICTGPHVKNTKEIGTFKITKEESSASGIRRIKAIVEN